MADVIMALCHSSRDSALLRCQSAQQSSVPFAPSAPAGFCIHHDVRQFAHRGVYGTIITRAMPATVFALRSLIWTRSISFSKAQSTARLLPLKLYSSFAFHRPATHPCQKTKTLRPVEPHCSGASRFRSGTPPGNCKRTCKGML